ncbi:hypothetical protein MRY87_13630 [bacterium]|nr:hypothetical protein [bacterium]
MSYRFLSNTIPSFRSAVAVGLLAAFFGALVLPSGLLAQVEVEVPEEVVEVEEEVEAELIAIDIEELDAEEIARCANAEENYSPLFWRFYTEANELFAEVESAGNGYESSGRLAKDLARVFLATSAEVEEKCAATSAKAAVAAFEDVAGLVEEQGAVALLAAIADSDTEATGEQAIAAATGGMEALYGGGTPEKVDENALEIEQDVPAAIAAIEVEEVAPVEEGGGLEGGDDFVEEEFSEEGGGLEGVAPL